MIPTKLIDNITKEPIYQLALDAYNKRDTKTCFELLHKLCTTSDSVSQVKKYHEEKKDLFDKCLARTGIQFISKTDILPEGYNRNTFSDKTCITTQKKDLPEWKNIITTIKYDFKDVYEDHQLQKLTTQYALYQIKLKYTNSFTGYIQSESSVEHTVNKFKKNCLYLIIDTLYITLRNVDYSVFSILEKLQIESLLEIIVTHDDKQYTKEELQILKLLFDTQSWKKLVIINQVEFEK